MGETAKRSPKINTNRNPTKKSIYLLGIHRVSGDKLRIPVLLPYKRYHKNKEEKIFFVL
jgi:hypothetical protein